MAELLPTTVRRLAVVACVALAGCGGGGGGGGGAGNGAAPSGGGDVTPPQVSSVIPGGVEVDVADPVQISVAFSEAIDRSSISSTSFRVADASGAPVSGSIVVDTAPLNQSIARFTPTQALARSTEYRVTLTTAIKDLAGNALAADHTASFKTITDKPWIPTSVTPNTASARWDHAAVWTGSEMIVFGGFVGTGVPATGTGARYDPVTDSWAAMASATSVGSPVGAVWTGTEMIVWTGFNGERYNPSTNTWTLVSQVSAPPGVSGQTAVWTGSEMIVWGGLGIGFTVNTGGRLNATTGTWSATSTAADAPSPRFRHSAVWTDKEMIVWGGGAPPAGGGNLTLLGDGARYDPVANTWTPISNIGAPTPRVDHTAVWTGKEMIVWGGSAGEDGARYDPMTNTWSPLASAGFRLGFVNHTAIWTGTEMIVWGGLVSPDDPFSKLGGRYNPATNTWRPVTRENNSLPHFEHTAVWTGAEMIIWGGLPSTGQSQPTPTPLQAGARYVP